MIDLNPSNDMQASFENYTSRRKTHQNKRVIADTIYARLRDAILSVELRPNIRLIEDELADWLNVSRTPVREALLHLEQDGLVVRDRGWLVRSYNLQDIRYRLECRLAIESYATRLAAICIPEADVQELKNLTLAMEKMGVSHLELFQINDRFHRIIVEGAKNPSLVNFHVQTKMNLWDLNVPVIFTPENDQLMFGQHHTLIDALALRDGDKAESIARSHVQLIINIVTEAFDLSA